MMDLKEFLKEVDFIVDVLKNNGVIEVEMLYGWSWGSWETFYCDITEVKNEIKKQETLTGGFFGENDVHVRVDALETEITFCHECDIHIEFNTINRVVTEILHHWNTRKIIHHLRECKNDIAFEDLPL